MTKLDKLIEAFQVYLATEYEGTDEEKQSLFDLVFLIVQRTTFPPKSLDQTVRELLEKLAELPDSSG